MCVSYSIINKNEDAKRGRRKEGRENKREREGERHANSSIYELVSKVCIEIA